MITRLPNFRRGRRGISVAAIVLILAAAHLAVIHSVTATADDALRSADRVAATRTEAAIASGLHIAAAELINGRSPPADPVALTDGSTVLIEVDGSARPYTVTLTARSGGAFRSHTFVLD